MIGGPGVREALEEKGFELLSTENAPDAKAFVMGIDRGINFDKVPKPLCSYALEFPSMPPILTAPSPPRAEKSLGWVVAVCDYLCNRHRADRGGQTVCPL